MGLPDELILALFSPLNILSGFAQNIRLWSSDPVLVRPTSTTVFIHQPVLWCRAVQTLVKICFFTFSHEKSRFWPVFGVHPPKCWSKYTTHHPPPTNIYHCQFFYLSYHYWYRVFATQFWCLSNFVLYIFQLECVSLIPTPKFCSSILTFKIKNFWILNVSLRSGLVVSIIFGLIQILRNFN